MRIKLNRWCCRLVAVAIVALALPCAHADFDSAMGYLKSRKYLEAAAEFQAIVDEHPDYADGHNLLGVCFLNSQKPEDAEKSFLKAIELNPESFDYAFNLANSYLARRQYHKVVGTLNNAEAYASDEQKMRVYAMRGSALAVQKKWDESIDDLEKATRAKPDARLLGYLGKAYFTVGENDKAAATLKQALKGDPSNSGNQKLLAESLMNSAAKAGSDGQKKARYAEAQTAARKLLQISPGSDAEYLVGRASLGAGDYDSAIASFEKVVAARPGHCNAKANLGKAYSAKKQWDRAVDAFTDATACNPKLAVAWEGKGYAYQKKASDARDGGKPKVSLGIYDRAVGAYKEGLDIKPSGASERAIQTCLENKARIEENLAMDAEERANQDAIEAEKQRQQQEEEKMKQWEEKRDDG